MFHKFNINVKYMYLLYPVPTYIENGLRPSKRIPDKIGLYLFASWSLVRSSMLFNESGSPEWSLLLLS